MYDGSIRLGDEPLCGCGFLVHSGNMRGPVASNRDLGHAAAVATATGAIAGFCRSARPQTHGDWIDGEKARAGFEIVDRSSCSPATQKGDDTGNRSGAATAIEATDRSDGRAWAQTGGESGPAGPSAVVVDDPDSRCDTVPRAAVIDREYTGP